MKKITLFLMTKRAYLLLRDTADKYHHLFDRVVIGKDAALDDDYSDAIAQFCEQHDLQWSFRESSPKIETEYALAVGWRWLIDFPQDKLIVFHDSLLPRYRGFNPLVSAMINGDSTVGVTALFGAESYDSGDIIAQASMPMSYPCTIAEAIDRIGDCYVQAALTVLEKISAGGPIVGTIQNEADATYSLWRDENDYWIDWSQPAQTISRMVDAVGSPYAGARTRVNDMVAKIGKATAIPDMRVENRAIGKVIMVDDGRPIVVCGEGLLRVDDLTHLESGDQLLPMEKFRSRFS